VLVVDRRPVFFVTDVILSISNFYGKRELIPSLGPFPHGPGAGVSPFCRLKALRGRFLPSRARNLSSTEPFLGPSFPRGFMRDFDRSSARYLRSGARPSFNQFFISLKEIGIRSLNETTLRALFPGCLMVTHRGFWRWSERDHLRFLGSSPRDPDLNDRRPAPTVDVSPLLLRDPLFLLEAKKSKEYSRLPLFSFPISTIVLSPSLFPRHLSFFQAPSFDTVIFRHDADGSESQHPSLSSKFLMKAGVFSRIFFPRASLPCSQRPHLAAPRYRRRLLDSEKLISRVISLLFEQIWPFPP